MSYNKATAKMALDECRMLVLGTQVLVGSECRAVFEPGFPRLPAVSQDLKLLSLALLLAALALLLWPVPYQHLVEPGEEESTDFRHFISLAVRPALFPFSLSLGLDTYVVVEKVAGAGAGAAAGALVGGAALGFLYGIEIVARWRKEPSQGKDAMSQLQEQEKKKPTPLNERITNVLTEARVALPGAQALLGFQLIAVLTSGFDKLPLLTRISHLVSLTLIALSTILLMTPAAYHRMVHEGEDTEEFYGFAHRMVLGAMVPLALGLSVELYVVAQDVLHSVARGAACAFLCFVVLGGLWFGYPIYRRSRRRQVTLPPGVTRSR